MEKRKNTDKFIEAYNKYSDQIYRYCFFRVYSKSLAEELTQETFMRAWKYISQKNEIRNVQAFLYQVCRNLITDTYRKKEKNGGEESLEFLMELRGNSMEPVYEERVSIEKNLMMEEMLKIIRSLPEAYRDLLILRYVENLSHKEIAVILKTNPRNISTRMGRAIKKLRTQAARVYA